jgi:hypothetical protein
MVRSPLLSSVNTPQTPSQTTTDYMYCPILALCGCFGGLQLFLSCPKPVNLKSLSPPSPSSPLPLSLSLSLSLSTPSSPSFPPSPPHICDPVMLSLRCFRGVRQLWKGQTVWPGKGMRGQEVGCGVGEWSRGCWRGHFRSQAT